VDVARTHITTTFRTEGGLLPADLLAKVAAGDPDVQGLKETDFGLAAGDRVREAITRSWNRLVGAWAGLTAARVAAGPNELLTSSTRERFLLPLFDELGFGRLSTARAADLQGYAISHISGQVPVHLVGFDIDLDRRTPGVRGAAGAAPHALVQEFLNRSDEHLWGIVSNGRLLRLLRDSTSLTRQAFVEFDLQAILEGQLYADFALLWLVCHRTRFGGEKPADCLLETWMKKAAEDGTRALDKLRGGVKHAIESLGAGFLANPANAALREELRTGRLDRQDYYRQLLRLVYRLIFLFAAEDRRDETTGRELLLDPGAEEVAASAYRMHYSTARLRRLASRKRGARHGDLWLALRRVSAALGGDGAPTLALPPLGSFLFGTSSCPHLDSAQLSNETLLDAVRGLATIEENRRLRTVDYRNLGAEELGGVYESLLELHPRIELDASPPGFELSSVAGNERKSTGSYYTPSSLINCLLDSALDPVIEDAVRGKDPLDAEKAILKLAIVDPAAGSGHFAISAAHRLAKRLATVRTGEGEPSPTATRHALRDVISHCIYAVDINPMAVELCKVGLWLDALEPGRPLSFLDAHVKVGNSLLGTSTSAASAGLPDEAFATLAGDNKTIAAAWRTRNTRELSGQRTLDEAGLHLPIDELAAASVQLDGLPETDLIEVATKEARHQALLRSPEYAHGRLALDGWCAAFVAPRRAGSPEITTSVVRALGTQPESVPAGVRAAVERIAAAYSLFHWELEFPAVFVNGGFDVVLGNPPWEQVKLREKEFFSERAPEIANAQKADERKRLIARLERTDEVLWLEFQDALRQAEGETHLLRNGGAYPLTGHGDINTFSVFAERMVTLIAPTGRLGAILPSAVATDATLRQFFQRLMADGHLRSFYEFENDGFFSAGQGHMLRFALMTVVGRTHGVSEADFLFQAHAIEDLADPDRHFTLTADEIALLNPNTLTCPIFQSGRASELTKRIYRRVPVLDRVDSEEGNPWNITFMAMFHMTNDSELFQRESSPNRLPLYEAKLIGLWNHRQSDFADAPPGERPHQLPEVPLSRLTDPTYRVTPFYWVDRQAVDARLSGRWEREWLVGWRGVTDARASARSVIASVMPRVATGNSLLHGFSDDPHFPLFVANLSSLVLDWIARQKIGGLNLSFHIFRQLAILPPSDYEGLCPWATVSVADWLRRYVVELAYTANEIRAFARDLGYEGPPFEWDALRRTALSGELDAAFLHLYGVKRVDAEYVLDSFDIVRRREEEAWGTYRTKTTVLSAYDSMATSSAEAPFVSRLTPPPGDPAAGHPPQSGEAHGRWLPWEPMAVQAKPPRRSISKPQSHEPRTVVFPETLLRSRGATERPSGVSNEQQQMDSLAAVTADGWVSESSIEPLGILMGARVRHRSRGTGTVLTVKAGPRSCELLINFDAGGEAWVAFGYGVLEFAE
jgi:N-6 DNA Methylase